MSDFTDAFMSDVRAETANRRTTYTNRFKKWAYYKGRKQIRDSPKTVLKTVVGHVPYAGTALTAAVDAAIGKVRGDRLTAKKAKYKEVLNRARADADSDGVVTEALRKLAKADAKDLKLLAEKIDTNMVKQKDAAAAAKTAVDAYKTLLGRDEAPTFETIWKTGLAICEKEHYEEKLLVMIETALARLGEMQEYLKKAAANTDQVEAEFTATLDELEATIRDGLATIRDADGYERLA